MNSRRESDKLQPLSLNAEPDAWRAQASVMVPTADGGRADEQGADDDRCAGDARCDVQQVEEGRRVLRQILVDDLEGPHVRPPRGVDGGQLDYAGGERQRAGQGERVSAPGRERRRLRRTAIATWTTTEDQVERALPSRHRLCAALIGDVLLAHQHGLPIPKREERFDSARRRPAWRGGGCCGWIVG